MAEKTLNTRILLKYDTYANWTSKNPVLKAGEMAIATINSGDTQEVNSVGTPQVLIKVGDGSSNYNSLKFISGRAADVYSWAKADKKPTYAASEITGISDYIAEYVETEMGISVDTDTQYQIVKVDNYNYKLQSKGKGDSAWADVANGAIVIPKYDDTEVKGDITALEGLVGTTAVATQIANAITALDLANTYEAKGEASKVQSALDTYKTQNDAVISAIKDGTSIDSFKDVEEALAGKQAAGDYATKAEAQSYADSKNILIEEAKKAGTDAQADVDTLQYVVDHLIGSDVGKSARTIASEEIAAQLIAEDAAESLDTLEEIAAWIQSHPNDASAMNAAIVALQNQLNGIAEGTGTVKKYVDDAITALKIGDYAKAADLTALAGRVTTLEGKAHTHDNKTVLDGITSAKVTAWDAAEQNAKDYADSLGVNYDEKGSAGSALLNAKKYTDDLDDSLAAIAKTGSTDDLVQGTNTLIFCCGDSTNCGA